MAWDRLASFNRAGHRGQWWRKHAAEDHETIVGIKSLYEYGW